VREKRIRARERDHGKDSFATETHPRTMCAQRCVHSFRVKAQNKVCARIFFEKIPQRAARKRIAPRLQRAENASKKINERARTNCPLLLGAAATFLLETTDFPAMATFAVTAVVMDKADIIRKYVYVECDI